MRWMDGIRRFPSFSSKCPTPSHVQGKKAASHHPLQASRCTDVRLRLFDFSFTAVFGAKKGAGAARAEGARASTRCRTTTVSHCGRCFACQHSSHHAGCCGHSTVLPGCHVRAGVHQRSRLQERWVRTSTLTTCLRLTRTSARSFSMCRRLVLPQVRRLPTLATACPEGHTGASASVQLPGSLGLCPPLLPL